MVSADVQRPNPDPAKGRTIPYDGQATALEAAFLLLSGGKTLLL